MKHDKGNDPSKWTKEDVKKLGSLITGFAPGDLKKLGRNKETFEARYTHGYMDFFYQFIFVYFYCFVHQHAFCW